MSLVSKKMRGGVEVMEEMAVGVGPAVSLAPGDDPFVRQLLDENGRLANRIQVLERRLLRYERAYSEIAAIVARHSGEKGVEG
mgnify:CR=1 FL=1